MTGFARRGVERPALCEPWTTTTGRLVAPCLHGPAARFLAPVPSAPDADRAAGGRARRGGDHTPAHRAREPLRPHAAVRPRRRGQCAHDAVRRRPARRGWPVLGHRLRDATPWPGLRDALARARRGLRAAGARRGRRLPREAFGTAARLDAADRRPALRLDRPLRTDGGGARHRVFTIPAGARSGREASPGRGGRSLPRWRRGTRDGRRPDRKLQDADRGRFRRCRHLRGNAGNGRRRAAGARAGGLQRAALRPPGPGRGAGRARQATDARDPRGLADAERGLADPRVRAQSSPALPLTARPAVAARRVPEGRRAAGETLG